MMKLNADKIWEMVATIQFRIFTVLPQTLLL